MKFCKALIFAVAVGISLVSCSETDNTYDPYDNWQARNAAWWESIVSEAHAEIDPAKTQWGDNHWQEHSQWRMYRTLYKPQSGEGTILDSICVKDLGNELVGDALAESIQKGSPTHSDSVRVSFRGYLMPTINYTGQGSEKDLVQEVFSTSYYDYGKGYNPSTATPILMGIEGLVEGLKTAMQYMKEGDHWVVYIPYKLGYNATAQGIIPAYSTLQFDIHLVKWYESGSGIPTVWE